jgi:hypothetical protein
VEPRQREGRALQHAQVALRLSQFLHGEQSAMIVASQLVGDVPWMDAWNAKEVREIVLSSPVGQMLRQRLVARVVPNLAKLGLITPRVRASFEKLGILQFESYDPTEQDRLLGLASQEPDPGSALRRRDGGPAPAVQTAAAAR